MMKNSFEDVFKIRFSKFLLIFMFLPMDMQLGFIHDLLKDEIK